MAHLSITVPGVLMCNFICTRFFCLPGGLSYSDIAKAAYIPGFLLCIYWHALVLDRGIG